MFDDLFDEATEEGSTKPDRDDFTPSETVRLHSELKAAMRVGRIGKHIHHPFVISPIYTPYLNAHLNNLFAYKTEAARRALEERNFDHYIQLHERPYRLDALLEIAQSLDDKDYWSLLGVVWVDSENIAEGRKQWQVLLGSARPERIEMMRSVSDRELYGSLPDDQPITIWRGTNDAEEEFGFSWTLDIDRAMWFAKRNALIHGGERMLLKAEVFKPSIIATFEHRGESEVLVVEGLQNIHSYYEPFSV
jgi:hypothetical protein